MKTIETYFASYEEYHQTEGNKTTHYIGIPMIVFAILGLLSLIKFNSFLDLALIFWFGSAVFYVRLNLKLGLSFSILTFLLYTLAKIVNFESHIVLFILGWALQLIGHYKFEKKAPAFITNLSHLFIGPLWIFNHILMSKVKK